MDGQTFRSMLARAIALRSLKAPVARDNRMR